MHALTRTPTQARRRRLGAVLAGLCALEALLLYLSPAEQTLGQVVKLVYLHGALIRAGLLAFTLAGLLGVAWLIWRRPALYARLVALQRAALVTWMVYLLSSMLVTYLAWGVAIAWGEPRVAATLRVSLAVLVLFAVSELWRSPALRAAANILLAGVALLATRSAGVIRHPIDPIGGSSSLAIKLFYAGIVAVMLAIVAVIAALWRRPSAPR